MCPVTMSSGAGPRSKRSRSASRSSGGEADLVELREADADGRVVHREDRGAFRRFELALDPADPLRADRTAGLALDQGVHVDDPNGAAVDRVVEELAGAGDAGVIREGLAQVLAPVVVAGDGVDGHLERLEELADPLVLRRDCRRR